MEQTKFAMCIKKARAKKGLTQKELAARLHVTDKAVSKWERALSFPDIGLLGDISKELEIPLSELLDVEDITSKTEHPEDMEVLLGKLLQIMKKRVQRELLQKKRMLHFMIGIFAVFAMLGIVTTAINYHIGKERMKEYWDSEHIISSDEVTVTSIDEKNAAVFLDFALPPEYALAYEIHETHWYDKEDPSVAYIQFYYMKKEYLLYESEKEYLANKFQEGRVPNSVERKVYIETGSQVYESQEVNGYNSFIPPIAIEKSLIDRDMSIPVTKIIYRGGDKDSDEDDMVLWEK